MATHVSAGALQTRLRVGIDARASFEHDISQPLDVSTMDVATCSSDQFVGLGRELFTTGRRNLAGAVHYQFGDQDTEAMSAGLTVSFSFRLRKG